MWKDPQEKQRDGKSQNLLVLGRKNEEKLGRGLIQGLPTTSGTHPPFMSHGEPSQNKRVRGFHRD